MGKYDHYEANHLKIEITDRVALITMDRPEKRNAVNPALHVGLEKVFREVGDDPDVGAIVLTGAGTAFCAGGDFGPQTNQSRGVSAPTGITRGPKYLVQRMVNAEVPTIAAINGPASGLGATIALLCDVTFMADTARIGDTHVNLGLVAGDGGAVIWPLLIGPNRAKEYLMAGKYADAETADKIGLVNHVVPADKLLDEATAYARQLANGATAAVRWTKMAINRMVWDNLNLVLEMSLATEALSVRTEDHKEAVAAFQQKRAPNFRGL